MKIKNILLTLVIGLSIITPIIGSFDFDENNIEMINTDEKVAGFDHEFDESFMPLDMWRSPEQFKEMTSKFNTWALANPDITLYEDHYKNITEDGFWGLDQSWDLDDVNYWLNDFYIWNWNYNLPDKTSKIDQSYFEAGLYYHERPMLQGGPYWSVGAALRNGTGGDGGTGGGIEIWFNNNDDSYDEKWHITSNPNAGMEALAYDISFPPLEDHLILPKEKNSIDNRINSNELVDYISSNYNYFDNFEKIKYDFEQKSLWIFLLNRDWFNKYYPQFNYDLNSHSWKFDGDISEINNPWLWDEATDWDNFNHNGGDPHFDFARNRENHILLDEPIIENDIKSIAVSGENSQLDEIENFKIVIETEENEFTEHAILEFNLNLSNIFKFDTDSNLTLLWILIGLALFFIIILIITIIFLLNVGITKKDDI